MPKTPELQGRRVGRLRVIAQSGHLGACVAWECQCDCGNSLKVRSSDLMHETTRSCGCLRKDTTSARSFKHGRIDSPVYNTWRRINAVCYNSSHARYKDYGGNGVQVHSPWRADFMKFEAYVTSLPGYGNPGMSLDRINNLGNYEPGNLRWATVTTQNRNSRSAKLTLQDARDIRTKFGQGSWTRAELAKLYKITRATVGHILNHRTWKEVSDV